MRNISLVLIALAIIFFSNAWAQTESIKAKPSDSDIGKFILANPEIILKSLKLYEEKEKVTEGALEQRLIEREVKTLYLGGSSYIGGNPDGSITMIEFIDYKCGYCKRAHMQIVELLKSNPEIRFVVKEFPILGEESDIAAKASIAILLDQGDAVYKKFTDKLLNFNGTISIDLIKDLIKSVDGKSFDIQKKMQSDAVYDVLRANYILAKKLKIRGTPTFIIGTEIIRGYKDSQTLQNIINKRKQLL